MSWMISNYLLGSSMRKYSQPSLVGNHPAVQLDQPPFYVPVIYGFTKHVSGTGGRTPRA
jgi:hypothetical protein